MIRFECDYGEGAHPQILEALTKTNFEQLAGYSCDEHCDKAREYIKRDCGRDDVDVHFVVGGTQANLIVIASILRPHQGVLAADSGHVNGHETGAIEATGHKVLWLKNSNGKISAEQIKEAYYAHWNDANHEHIVQPGMVYISQPTEYGTLYSLDELQAIYSICRALSLPLFVDGARLGYAMAADKSITLEAMCGLCDVFYIGGTKVGMLCGEAIVIVNEALKRDFRYIVKQRGGMLAKGRVLGVQFETMFEDGLYYRVAENAVTQAQKIKKAFQEKGIGFLIESDTNQQFPVLTKAQQAKLAEKYTSCYWEGVDAERDCIRFCTSWASTSENVDALVKDIMAL